MTQADLLQLNNEKYCTIYTIQFISEDEGEYFRFINKFKNDVELNEDLFRIVQLVDAIADVGALERMFRPEGKMNDNVCALPIVRSRLRLYCLRLSDRILILGNGGVKNTRTYNENDELKGYVMTLQKFDKLIREGIRNGSIRLYENRIETNKSFDL